MRDCAADSHRRLRSERLADDERGRPFGGHAFAATPLPCKEAECLDAVCRYSCRCWRGHVPHSAQPSCACLWVRMVGPLMSHAHAHVAIELWLRDLAHCHHYSLGACLGVELSLFVGMRRRRHDSPLGAHCDADKALGRSSGVPGCSDLWLLWQLWRAGDGCPPQAPACCRCSPDIVGIAGSRGFAVSMFASIAYLCRAGALPPPQNRGERKARCQASFISCRHPFCRCGPVERLGQPRGVFWASCLWAAAGFRECTKEWWVGVHALSGLHP